MKTKHQILFTIVITSAVISFWRGITGLMDVYLMPEDPSMSYLISLLLGLIILVSTHYAAKELI